MKSMKKKILFLTPSLAIGGAERVLVNLLKKIDFDRYDVTLCLYSRTGVYFSELPKEVNVISIFRNHTFSRLLTFLQRKWNITFLLKFFVAQKISYNYDIGVCFSDGLLTDVLLMARNHFKKTLSWVHSCYNTQTSLKKIYTSKKADLLRIKRYKKLDGIVFVSKQSQQDFELIFGKVDKEYCVYNIFDFDTLSTKSALFEPILPEKVINFIAIGRLVQVKEYNRLIDAAKILKERGLKFHINILGDGPLRNDLEIKINRLCLNDVICLLGFMSNPYPYLKNSDILVLTSSSEALPTVLIEAMYFSKPIIATKCPGCIEITDNGKYGLLTEHNAEDIAKKMEEMLLNEKIRQHYIELSSERIKIFNENTTINKIYNIFDNL